MIGKIIGITFFIMVLAIFIYFYIKELNMYLKNKKAIENKIIKTHCECGYPLLKSRRMYEGLFFYYEMEYKQTEKCKMCGRINEF